MIHTAIFSLFFDVMIIFHTISCVFVKGCDLGHPVGLLFVALQDKSGGETFSARRAKVLLLDILLVVVSQFTTRHLGSILK